MIPESEKLEPCPFCGVDDAKLVDATRILGSWKVVHRCKTVGYLCVEVSDRDRAISDWNRRASHLTRQEDETRRAALEEADGWLPIETAPRDGREVILFFPTYREDQVGVYCWRNVAGPEWEGINGWSSDVGPEEEDTPTHWRPLPDPPRALSQKGDKADG